MQREVITQEELLSRLNEALSKYPDYYECKYESVKKLEKPDETGCNWSDAFLKCSGMHPGTCQPAAFKLVKELKEKYNVL